MKDVAESSMYMARKKYYVPKDEIVRDYINTKDRKVWYYIYEAEYEVEYAEDE